jgi:PleD family two-component response regulator
LPWHHTELLSQKHILFVEDHVINQKVGLRMHQALGGRAKLVSNGEECLAAMTKNQFDLVLMDCQVSLHSPSLACSVLPTVAFMPFFYRRLLLLTVVVALHGRCR